MKSNLQKMQEENEEKQKLHWKQRNYHKDRRRQQYKTQIMANLEEIKEILEIAQNAIQNDNYQVLKRNATQAEILFHELRQLAQRIE